MCKGEPLPADEPSVDSAPSWPSSTETFSVTLPGGENFMAKVAQEGGILQLCMEERPSLRQFSASFSREECSAIVQGVVKPEVLKDMFHEALSAKPGHSDVTAGCDLQACLINVHLHYRSKWAERTFTFILQERKLSEVDLLERRLNQRLKRLEDDNAALKLENSAIKSRCLTLEGDLATTKKAIVTLKKDLSATRRLFKKKNAAMQKAITTSQGACAAAKQRLEDDLEELEEEQGLLDHAFTQICQEVAVVALQEQANKATEDEKKRCEALKKFAITVERPRGYGHTGMSPRTLLEDSDYTQKRTVIATSSAHEGDIEACFLAPIYVKSVKIAPNMHGYIAKRGLVIQAWSVEQGAWVDVKRDIPKHTTEQTFAVNMDILKLRLTGTDICITKLIFN